MTVFMDLYFFNWLLRLDRTDSNALFLKVQINKKLHVAFETLELVYQHYIHFTFQTILWTLIKITINREGIN